MNKADLTDSSDDGPKGSKTKQVETDTKDRIKPKQTPKSKPKMKPKAKSKLVAALMKRPSQKDADMKSDDVWAGDISEPSGMYSDPDNDLDKSTDEEKFQQEKQATNMKMDNTSTNTDKTTADAAAASSSGMNKKPSAANMNIDIDATAVKKRPSGNFATVAKKPSAITGGGLSYWLMPYPKTNGFGICKPNEKRASGREQICMVSIAEFRYKGRSFAVGLDNVANIYL